MFENFYFCLSIILISVISPVIEKHLSDVTEIVLDKRFFLLLPVSPLAWNNNDKNDNNNYYSYNNLDLLTELQSSAALVNQIMTPDSVMMTG